MASNGYDRKFGARPMGRLIDKKIRKPLADAILFGDLRSGGFVTVIVNEEGLTLDMDPRPPEASSRTKKRVGFVEQY